MSVRKTDSSGGKEVVRLDESIWGGGGGGGVGVKIVGGETKTQKQIAILPEEGVESPSFRQQGLSYAGHSGRHAARRGAASGMIRALWASAM